MNPGGSVKDRIGLAMIEAAEKEGKLKPGGTIVEPTSGNTGVGLAIAAALRGYHCIFVMPDKVAREKIALLRAYGAEVIVCPTAVAPESPESYYSVSNRLTEEIPGAFKPDQYSNQANPEAHYATTGPEMWEQTGGELDVIVFSVGTGGTISGTAKYLKEQKPDLHVVGADPEGSIYSSETVHTYLVEGIGEDFWPTTYDPSLVDEYVTVSDARLVPHRAPAGPRGRDPRRRLRRHGRVGDARGREALRQGHDDRDAHPRLRARLPVEALRRQLARGVRHPRARHYLTDASSRCSRSSRRRRTGCRGSSSSSRTRRSAPRSS